MPDNDRTIHVVLTDDDGDDRELFREAVGRLGIKTDLQTFSDCEKMVKSLLKDRTGKTPDVIFLDVNMPGKNGLACLRELREDVEFARVPVIMFTTSARLIDIQQARKFGANLFLNKPSDFNELTALLKKLLSPAGYRTLVTANY